jgi:hypothetical protein
LFITLPENFLIAFGILDAFAIYNCDLVHIGACRLETSKMELKLYWDNSGRILAI